jgi:hypothetical protein
LIWQTCGDDDDDDDDVKEEEEEGVMRMRMIGRMYIMCHDNYTLCLHIICIDLFE